MNDRKTDGNTPYPSLIDGFQDKVVVVLGGASGIGLDTARAFWEQGARVTILGLLPVPGNVREQGSDAVSRYTDDKIKEFKAEMPEIPGNAPRHEVTFMDCNVATRLSPEITASIGDHLEIQQRLKEVAQKNGNAIDVLVDSVGWRPRKDPREVTPEWRSQVIDTNSGYLPFVFQTIEPLMANASNGGRVVIVGSTLPHGNSNIADEAYAAAKAARLGAASTAINVLGAKGISVNIVSPGHVDNEAERIQLGVEEAMKAEKVAIANRAVATSLTGQDVAKSILFYASDQGRFHTGEHLVGASRVKVTPTSHFMVNALREEQAKTNTDFGNAALNLLGDTQRQFVELALKSGQQAAELAAAQRALADARAMNEGLTRLLVEHGAPDVIERAQLIAINGGKPAPLLAGPGNGSGSK